MTKKELELANKNAVMHGHIKSMGLAITDLLKDFGIGGDSVEKDDQGNMKIDVPAIIGKLSRKVFMNDFNDQSIKNLVAIMPIMKLYLPDAPIETKPEKPKRKW